MLVRLATTLLYHRIIIWKLNYIMINRLTNPRPSMFLNKWWFITNEDWEIPETNCKRVILETILDATLQALAFQHSPLDYLEERALRFVDVTNIPELAIELENDSQPITDSEDNKTRNE